MSEIKITKFRSGHPGRLFWIIGLAVGIVAGGAVALGIANSAASSAVSDN